MKFSAVASLVSLIGAAQAAPVSSNNAGTFDTRSYTISHNPHSPEAIKAGVKIDKRQYILAVNEDAEQEETEVAKRQYILAVNEDAEQEEAEVAKRQYILAVNEDAEQEEAEVAKRQYILAVSEEAEKGA